MADVPGNGAKIAGQDYCSIESDDTNDLDLGPGGLTVENSPGGERADEGRR